jgi:hypothetical protein
MPKTKYLQAYLSSPLFSRPPTFWRSHTSLERYGLLFPARILLRAFTEFSRWRRKRGWTSWSPQWRGPVWHTPFFGGWGLWGLTGAREYASMKRGRCELASLRPGRGELVSFRPYRRAWASMTPGRCELAPWHLAAVNWPPWHLSGVNWPPWCLAGANWPP